jgi:NAD-dependent dihydropyrimidine dehydrogenase PreA subunit
MAEHPYPLKSREVDKSMLLKGKWIVSLLLFIIAASAIAMIWIYQVDPSICNGCARCIPYCTTGALSMYGSNAVIDPALCNGCGDCVPPCIRGAIYKYWYVGISEDETESHLSFGPNPTIGSVFVTGAAVGEPVEVFDLSGRLVASTIVSPDGEAVVDLSDLASGNYLILVGLDELKALTLIK